ncbi:MAG: 2-oxo-4-hydroxy-4-carboxy-5-ureidoimidazoline decarboxylase [Candidatus Tyrphobacter sp.]
MAVTIAQLNAADRAAFVAAVGFTFEGSPWIAQEAWSRRPFANAQALLAAMLAAVAAAPEERRVALICAHPDLGGHMSRRGRLTVQSLQEQAAAGLAASTPAEMVRFDELNGAYRERFGFPFVICAREHTKGAIFAALERRLGNDRATEIASALEEIGKIARLRLLDAVA